jgi:hypothetical protein
LAEISEQFREVRGLVSDIKELRAQLKQHPINRQLERLEAEGRAATGELERTQAVRAQPVFDELQRAVAWIRAMISELRYELAQPPAHVKRLSELHNLEPELDRLLQILIMRQYMLSLLGDDVEDAWDVQPGGDCLHDHCQGCSVDMCSRL